MRVAVSTTLFCGATGYAVLPDGKTWADVESWYVKWDTLHLAFKGGTTEAIDLASDASDGTDWKRPLSATVHPVSDEGVTDYNTELDSQE